MFLSELQSKDIISTKDGRRLGRIIDAEINNQGQIITLVLEEKKSFKRIMISTNDSKVPFTSITKIGEDVILADIWYNVSEV